MGTGFDGLVDKVRSAIRISPERMLLPIAGTFPGAAWWPEPASGAVMGRWWAPYVAASLPLLILGWRLLQRWRYRRRYLNRRLPRLPPVLHDIFVEAPRRLASELAQIPSDRINA